MTRLTPPQLRQLAYRLSRGEIEEDYKDHLVKYDPASMARHEQTMNPDHLVVVWELTLHPDDAKALRLAVWGEED